MSVPLGKLETYYAKAKNISIKNKGRARISGESGLGILLG